MKNSYIFIIVILILFTTLLSCQKKEQRVQNYPNGRIKIRWFVIKDREGNFIKHGLSSYWFSNGVKKKEGQFINGKKNGIWNKWYQNGMKWIESYYMNELRDGKTTEWYQNGKKKRIGYYSEGSLTKEEWWTSLGQKTRLKETRHSNGLLKERFYIVEKLEDKVGRYTQWNTKDEKVEEGFFLEGKKHGHWANWYTIGKKKSEGYYENGEKNGHWVNWHINGKKKSEGYYQSGKKRGRWIYWDESGNIESQGDYYGGKKHGKWKEKYIYLHPYGTVEAYYISDRLHGSYMIFRHNGDKCIEGIYKNGKLHGSYIVWGKNGKQVSEGLYKNGKKYLGEFAEIGCSGEGSRVVERYLYGKYYSMRLTTCEFP